MSGRYVHVFLSITMNFNEGLNSVDQHVLSYVLGIVLQIGN